jgi:hypothetical protein
MSMMRNAMRILLAASAAAAVMPSLAAAADAARHEYPSCVVLVSNMGGDLYQTLEARFQKGLQSNPVKVDNLEAPLITPITVNDGEKKWAGVSVSAGYIGLINRLAHAKAIDEIKPGYFNKYALYLAAEGGGGTAAEAPSMADSRYWTDEMMNRQASLFNGMIGMTVALSLSHHYLGRYNQYVGEMPANKPVPINNILLASAWEYDVRAAALNCLTDGLPVEGARALFDAIDKMPTRPPWTALIAPPGADLKKMSKQLKVYEDQFFTGKLNLNDWK